jgi:hypothetical protein
MNVEHAVFSAGLAAEGGVGGVFQGGQVAVFRWKSAVTSSALFLFFRPRLETCMSRISSNS